MTRAPGMPEPLRCNAGAPGCINHQLATPWYIVFGNHDGYVRGTLPAELGINEAAAAFGRRFMLRQSDFVKEFFNTKAKPGPIGHGFGHVEPARLNDGNDRNDGYYAFDAGDGRFRMIVLNTIIDGVDPRIPTDLLRNPAALAICVAATPTAPSSTQSDRVAPVPVSRKSSSQASKSIGCGLHEVNSI